MVVQHNLRAMNSNRMLGLTASTQSKSTEKLSSGYKINRAADDAAGLSISEKMRKQIRGLSQASLNASDGISAVQTAEGALNEVQDMLQRMNELAVKAANGTMSEKDRGYIQDEIKQLTTEIDRVAETTKFNETYLLKGDVYGPKSTEYAYAETAAVAGQMLYTMSTDGTITEVKEGTVLNPEETYYTNKIVVGEKIAADDLTAVKQNVGTVLDITAGGADAGTYVDQANLITASNLYVKSGNTFVEVNVGDQYTGNVGDYYTVTTSTAGQIEYTAVANTATIHASKNVAKAEMLDENGKKVEVGAQIDTSRTYYSTTLADKGANAGKYTEKVFVVDNSTTQYYTKENGSLVKVEDGTAFSDTETYYTKAAGSNEAVEATNVATTAAYKTTTQIFDEDGNTVAAGITIDVSKTYYASKVDALDGEVTDLASISKDATGFQFCDKDGNEIAENGLYKYFNEDGTYKKGSLYMKNAAGELTAVTDDKLVDSYVAKNNTKVSALSLSFQVGADATLENKIEIELEAMDATTLGVKGISVGGEDDTNARNAIETITAAIEKVSAQRSALGAVQNRLEHTIANLDNVVENTTAAESQIRDTDMATEMVKYSNNNILAQAGQAMLAQANQANQGVLSLLG